MRMAFHNQYNFAELVIGNKIYRANYYRRYQGHGSLKRARWKLSLFKAVDSTEKYTYCSMDEE